MMNILKDVSVSVNDLKTIQKAKIPNTEKTEDKLIDKLEFSFLEMDNGKIKITDKTYVIIKTKEELQDIFDSLPLKSSSKHFANRRASVPFMKFFALSEMFGGILTKPKKSYLFTKETK